MISNKDVFAKRKQGELDEAYQIALELMSSPHADAWDKKALGWCLIDLIKRDSSKGDERNLSHYCMQLESIEPDPSDEVLAKGIRYALSLCNPLGQQVNQAKALSREGRHAEALAVYRKALATCLADREVQTGFGWEIYKLSKELITAENINLGAIKRNLNDYLKLDIEKPSLLHTCILQLAAKLPKLGKFSMLAFSRLWNLEYLRPEDFDRHRGEDGKEYPSLAEKVIQQASKEAATTDDVNGQRYILPYINEAIEKFPDNIWLKLDKVKVLIPLGLHDEALAIGIEVALAKSNDYWAWGLLGDILIQSDKEAALGCYCKALTCSAEDKFTGKIRTIVAQHMLENNNFSAAKRETEIIIRSKESEGYKIPEEVAEIASQPWFAQTKATSSNNDFYLAHCPVAEAILFSGLPWIEACVGDKYSVPGKEGKPRRRIFVKTASLPMEASIPESKLGPRKLAPGDPIRVKGKFGDNQRFNIFVFENRESAATWDVFSEMIGVVDHVNREKGVLHFIVDREIDGVVSLSVIAGPLREGDSIAVKLSKFTSTRGPTYRVHEATATVKQPSAGTKKQFCEEVRVSNGMGFTENDIFIAPTLVAEYHIQDGQSISGTALLNFNKKRSSWGWKAISIVNI